MRILILNTAYPPPMIGGAEKAVSLLASGLVRQGHSVHVVAKHDRKEIGREMIEGVEVTRLPVDNLYWPFSEKSASSLRKALWHLIEMWNLRTAYRVGRLMDEFKPDVFHTQNHSCFSVAVWSQAQKRGIRIVHTMHDYSLFCSRSTSFHRNKNCRSQCSGCYLYSILRKAASSSVDHAIAVSSRTLELHQKQGYFATTPSTVIHNICESPSIQHGLLSSREEGTALCFGFIGRITREKGIEVMLQSFSRLTSSDWCLKIAGAGDAAYLKILRQRYPSPRISWLGYLPAQQFYQAIKVAIIPSLWEEPMPYIAVEALMHGKPIIASNVGGMAEAVNRAPVKAIFAAGDVVGLAAALQHALDHRKLWEATHTLHDCEMSDFHEAAVLRAHLEIYHNLNGQTH